MLFRKWYKISPLIITILISIIYYDWNLNSKNVETSKISQPERFRLFGSVLHCFENAAILSEENKCILRSILIDKETKKDVLKEKKICLINLGNMERYQSESIIHILNDHTVFGVHLYIVECIFNKKYIYGKNKIEIKLFSKKSKKPLKRHKPIVSVKEFDLIYYQNSNNLFIWNTCICTSPIVLSNLGDVHDFLTYIYQYSYLKISAIFIYYTKEVHHYLKLVKENLDKFQLEFSTIFKLIEFDLKDLEQKVESDKLLITNYCLSTNKYRCKSFIIGDPDEIILPENLLHSSTLSRPIDYYSFLLNTTHNYNSLKNPFQRCSIFDGHIALKEEDEIILMKKMKSTFHNHLQSFTVKFSNFIRIQVSTVYDPKYNVLPFPEYFRELDEKLSEFNKLKKRSEFKGKRFLRGIAFKNPRFSGQRKYFCRSPHLVGFNTHQSVQTLSQYRDKTADRQISVDHLLSKEFQTTKETVLSSFVPKFVGINLHHRISMKSLWKKSIEKNNYHYSDFYFIHFANVSLNFWLQ
ncbi:hypothetical protein SNEBB_004619 [Seison nebaliae]|nr:hypothetical protein SNEBB_004619 [Seison nebaliae]